MKWKNKGHELDSYAKKLIKMFNENQKKIYIFGAGFWGGEIAPILEKFHCFAGYIDNDTKKQATGINNIDVISLEKYKRDGANGLIIIAVDDKKVSDIEKQLNDNGLIKNRDYFLYAYFLKKIYPVLVLYEFGYLYVDFVQICLTERCTLKCKDCAHGCFAVDMDNSDMDIEIAKESVDTLFSKIDFGREFTLLGGEPFLYAHLSEIIEYIGKKYRNKMQIFSIATNGTIIPQINVLELCKKYDLLIRISNYSSSIDWIEARYEQLQKELDKYSISYSFVGDSEWQWMDYGFKTVDRKGNGLIEVFDKCQTPCREIRGNKFYFCVAARSASENLKFNAGKEDYLDFKNLSENYKKEILEFHMGYSEKGYLDMCNYCNGADAVNYPIPVAQQLT